MKKLILRKEKEVRNPIVGAIQGALRDGPKGIEQLISEVLTPEKPIVRILNTLAYLINNGYVDYEEVGEHPVDTILKAGPDEAAPMIIWTKPNPSKPGSQRSPTLILRDAEQAVGVAQTMQQRHGGTFYVMKAVAMVRPVAQTETVRF